MKPNLETFENSEDIQTQAEDQYLNVKEGKIEINFILRLIDFIKNNVHMHNNRLFKTCLTIGPMKYVYHILLQRLKTPYNTMLL